jgi:type I restriction enzyme R subunit
VDELDQEKLSPLLQLKYHALSDAFVELGKPNQVRRVFVGFQRYLYAMGPAGGPSTAARHKSALEIA